MNDTELSKSANSGRGAECLRSRLRSRAVKRAYFALTCTAMHAHPLRFTAIVSKLTSSFFYQALPHLILYSLFRVDKMFGLQSERNGVSDNANRERQLAAGGVSDNANRLRRHSAANWERQLAGTNWRHSADLNK